MISLSKHKLLYLSKANNMQYYLRNGHLCPLFKIGICSSIQNKWLENTEKCLGVLKRCKCCKVSGRTAAEPFICRLRKNGVGVVTKPHKTLLQEFPSPKVRPPLDLQTNVVYRLLRSDCLWSYTNETGRFFCFLSLRKIYYIRNVKPCNKVPIFQRPRMVQQPFYWFW